MYVISIADTITICFSGWQPNRGVTESYWQSQRDRPADRETSARPQRQTDDSRGATGRCQGPGTGDRGEKCQGDRTYKGKGQGHSKEPWAGNRGEKCQGERAHQLEVKVIVEASNRK